MGAELAVSLLFRTLRVPAVNNFIAYQSKNKSQKLSP